MSSRRRTQEAITRRAAVLLLCVRVRRRGGNENEHELVDEGIIKELSFLHTTTCACFTAARVLVLEHPLEHHLPARVSPLPLLVCTPSQQRAVGPIAACAPREIQQQRTHAIACSYCGPGRGPRKKPQQCLGALPARTPRSLLEGMFIGLSRRVLVRIAPYFGSSRLHRRRRRRCTRAAA